MANLISAASGNFTSAGTWGAVEEVSELDSEIASTAISTSNLDSVVFIPGGGVPITVSAGWASSSSNYPSRVAANAFNGFVSVEGTEWLGTGGGVDWLEADLQTATALVGYSVQVNSDGSQPGRYPKNWTFEGSSNNSTWNVIDTQTNQTGWAASETRTFSFAPTSYRYWRLNITANNGDVTYTQVGELRLLVPGTIAPIDGVALKLAARAVSPSGTFTVTLRNSTTSTNVQSVTVNVSDLNASGFGWFFFKFGATETPNGTDSYVIRVVCSTTGSQVTLFRNATANNWSRKLRTTTTQAPTTDTGIIITNELTGAGTSNAITVTMNNIATTSFGPIATNASQGIVISGGGTLTFGTAASTDYYLKWKGALLITSGGTLNVGTSGTPIPSTSTAVLEMDTAINIDTYIFVAIGGFFNVWGPTKTICTLITVDAATSATSLTVGDTTGWEAGDTIVIADNNYYDAPETKTINTVPTSTSLTITAGLGQARTNVPVWPVEVINQKCRVKIRGTSSSNRGAIMVRDTGQMVARYCEFYWMGTGATNFWGITPEQTGTGLMDIQHCSIHTFDNNATPFYFGYTAGAGANTTISFCGFTDYSSAFGGGAIFLVVAGAATSIIIEGNYSIGIGGSTAMLYQFQFTKFKNNRIANQSSNQAPGIWFKILNSTAILGPTQANADDWSGNVIHNCETSGLNIVNETGLNFNNGWCFASRFWLKNWTIFRSCMLGGGADINIFGVGASNFTFENCVFGSGGGYGVLVNQVPYATAHDFTFDSCTFCGTVTNTSYTMPSALGLFGSVNDMKFINCDLGKSGTGYGAITTIFSYPGVGIGQLIASNCGITNFTNLTTNLTSYDEKSYLKINKYNRTSGDHRSYFKYGNVTSDLAIYYTGAPSERLTPSNASSKLMSGYATVSVPSGSAVTFSVHVRKSASGDGAAYNGSQPRLILQKCYEGGITSDVVLATASGTTGAWETLVGTTASVTDDCVLLVYVDCDGTTGWVNVDDWTKS